MNQKQKELFSEKLLKLANILFCALVFGQIMTKGIAKIFIIVLGVFTGILSAFAQKTTDVKRGVPLYLYSLRLRSR